MDTDLGQSDETAEPTPAEDNTRMSGDHLKLLAKQIASVDGVTLAKAYDQIESFSVGVDLSTASDPDLPISSS